MKPLNIDEIPPFSLLTEENYLEERQNYIDSGMNSKIIYSPWYSSKKSRWENDPEAAAKDWDTKLCPGGYEEWKENRKLRSNYEATSIIINKVNEIVDRINTYPNTPTT